MKAKKILKAECTSCDGTGLYRGMCEAEGEAVICLTCNGTGCEDIRYIPFKKRIPIKGVRTVRMSRGSFLASGVGGVGSSITYKEFKSGVMPGMKKGK